VPDNRIANNQSHLDVWDQAAALKQLDEDQELLNDMIDLFLKETPARILDLENALAQDNLIALADAAHALKGMAGHFCADLLQSSAASLEHSARQGDPANFQQMTTPVVNAALSLISILQQSQGTHL
jgi:HPt (histidine-containing phosphotransfer) domain-containing protein